MTLYVIATLGMFGGVLALRRGGKAVDQVSDLNGLVKHKPGMAIGLLILIFSVAGIPPAAGFWGKLQVFKAGIQRGHAVAGARRRARERGVAGLLPAPRVGDVHEAAGRAAGPHGRVGRRRRCC